LHLLRLELNNENDRINKINSQLDIDRTNLNNDERKQQLECEVQYFKQQIELLLHENNHLNGYIMDDSFVFKY
jgi:hypothetical protein